MKKGLIIGIVGIVIILGLIVYLYFGGEEEFVVEDEEWFQTGNTQKITQFETKLSEELENNKIGQMTGLREDVHTQENIDYFIEQNTITLGAKWVRLSVDIFDWNAVEGTDLYSKHSINPIHDRMITELIDNGLTKIMYTLVFWEEGLQYETEDYSRFKTEEEIQHYLDYVQFIANHFKNKIEYYEILNEPNIPENTPQDVRVEDYINLVKLAVPIIREEDPNAKIVVGAITPLFDEQLSPHEYLFSILESDVMPLVDGISWHVGAASPDYEIFREFYYNYPSLVQEIKDTASAHGFEGEYIAEELIWRTPATAADFEPWLYSNEASAKYYARGIVTNLGMNLTTGLALENLEVQPLMVKTILNLATIMAGAIPTNLPIEIESEATNIEYYTFSLSNDDKLIALWTDGVAVDEDSGVSADLTITGISPQEAIAIDVLNDYTQPLTIEENTIKDLIVRDYPLIIQIS